MDKPNFDRMWETFIRIGEFDIITPNKPFIDVPKIIQIIRFKINPMISRLLEDGVINWYCFLIHGKDSGVPTTRDDNNAYFHIRVSAVEDKEPSFPDYCIMTRKIKRDWVSSITGINKSLLKNEEIEEAWRIIGEQTEWLLNMLDIYKEDIELPPNQIAQFYHFFANMTQIGIL
jgi:hypothetical protein